MSKYLNNLIRIYNDSLPYETSKYVYNISYANISVDLFVLQFSFSVIFWVSRESLEERNRWFNEYMENIFEKFELTEAVAPAPKKSAKKTTTKKPATKKKTTTKK